MPKQVYKIENFHGGLNSDADPRDIDENQLSTLSGFVVDEVGKVRMMGGLADHGAPDPTNGTFRAGYGCFYFTADRKGAHTTPHGETLSGVNSVGVASVTMTNNGSSYETTASVVFDDPDVSGGVTALGTCVMEANTVASVTINTAGTGYTSAPDATFSGGGGVGAAGTPVLQTGLAYLSHPKSNGRWPVDGLIGALVKNTTDGSEIVITDNTATTVVGTLAGGTDNDWDVSDAYTITEFPETGDDYLVHVDCDTTSAVMIYSRLSNTWSPSMYPINLGSDGDVEPTFYSVDGALRISDGNFGASNTNTWYSYIDREYLKSLGGNSVKVDKWTSTGQKIDKPASTSGFDNVTADAYTDYDEGPTSFTTTTTKSDTVWYSTEDQVYEDDNAMDNVSRIIVVIKATATDSSNNELDYTVTAGEANGSSFTANSQTQSATGTVGSGGHYKSFYFYFNAVGPQITITNGVTAQGIRVVLTDVDNGSAIDDFEIYSAQCWAGAFTGSTHSNLAADNVMFEIDDDTLTTASGWNKDWNVGVSFIYDEVQESLIRELLDVDNNAATCTIASGKAPDIKLSIKYSGWNERITGINLYMREATELTKESWFLQSHYDLIAGVGRTYPNGVDNNFVYETSISESQCSIPKEQVIEPNLVDSYEIVAGMKPDEKSILSKYKTAVVVNRVVYIGGLEVHYEDGTTEVMGDAMIKSPVNKFDLFPLSRIIEVSVRDGDSIIKLEEYADRILQFKKNKMHLVNVSQEVEFLEDTFMHKGVSTPAAVCKTDFGVAWVNKHGCYFYDGNRVNNLLEKGGRRLISDDDWASFITVKDESDNVPGGSMIGYIPKKRQLIVVRDSHNSSNSGDIYLYDMVTQSWTFGDSKFLGASGAEERRTNFVNDWNGDLVHINDEVNGSVFKWDDAAIGKSNIDASAATAIVAFRTKDIDFGQPAQRKKVYRVRISYKGDADSLTIKYSVNGDTDTLYDFEGTASNGKPTGSTDTTPLLDKTDVTVWHHAELKPDTSSEASNIYSFQLHMTGTADSDFEINDISIIYRLKNIK